VNLDNAFDIYEKFLLQNRMQDHIETARCDDEGNERIRLKFDSGFTVELTNKKNVENSAVLRCWWKDEEPVNVKCLEQLLREFGNSN
jgi:hypothetical protein